MAEVILGWPGAPARRGFGFIGADAVQAPSPAASGHGSVIADATEAHTLVVAPTGTGKGRSLVLPNLLHWPHSAIVVDVKGEAALATARYRRSLGQPVVVLDPFRQVSQGEEGLNPMDWLSGEPDHVGDNASTLSETLTGDAVGHKEPFWDHTANDFVAGLIAHAATSTNPDDRNLGFVYDALTADDVVMGIATMLDSRAPMHPYARRQLVAFCQHEGEKVRTSVVSTAQQHLRIFASELVRRSVARTSFDLGALQRGEPVSIYLVLPVARLRSHSALLRIWLSVLLGVIAERREQPLAPTLLIVDELAQIGAVPLILQALTLLRGYGLRVIAILQTLAQLRSMWPADHQTVIDKAASSFRSARTGPTGPGRWPSCSATSRPMR